MIAAKLPADAPTSNDLFRLIGAFLADHGLGPDPSHYAFAYHALRDADGPIAEAIAGLTDGGLRLTSQQIVALGGSVSSTSQPLLPENGVFDVGAMLAAQVQLQVEGFASIVRQVHDEAHVFGRDLAASADAIRHSGDPMGIEEIVELTGLMVERVRMSERRLQRATEEANDLRSRLEEAHGSARRDPLTDLPNRRAFEEAFAALDPAVTACLAICDIDRFKQVNDGFGHVVGDRVLTAIGQALAAHCAPHLVARYGGEEFVVLVTGGSNIAAQELVDGARTIVSAKRFRSRDTGELLGTITFSAGVGCVRQGETLDDALPRIDRALYAAKEQGRDQVALADD